MTLRSARPHARTDSFPQTLTPLKLDAPLPASYKALITRAGEMAVAEAYRHHGRQQADDEH
jgi:hypothetical protein